MTHDETVKWYCINSDCQWSMVTTITLPGEPAPRCVCGELMQRVQTSRASSYLDFLRREPVRPQTRAFDED